MLLIGKGVVTGKIKETLERRKYAPKVRDYLRISEQEFDNIYWQAHADALKKVGSTSLRKLI